MLITISREYGAGGSEVARRVADALGWSVVDNEMVERVALRAGRSTEEVARRDERAPGFVERLARALATSTPELFSPPAPEVEELEESRLVKITESVVAEVAAQGRVVLVGRAAPAVLGRYRDALHVRVVAPKEYRLTIAAERLGGDARLAEKTLEEMDRNRARYHRDYYQRDWSDPVHFHMVLNTALLGMEGASAVIVSQARRLGWDRADADT